MLEILGLHPYEIAVTVLVLPVEVGILQTKASAGVISFLPPNGAKTQPPPTVESKFDEIPFLEQIEIFLRLCKKASLISSLSKSG